MSAITAEQNTDPNTIYIKEEIDGQKLREGNLLIPQKGSAKAAGFDLRSAEETTVPAYGKALISTGFSMTVPEGTYGRIAPRSGLALKNHIATGAGVIDRDYRGTVGIVLFNHGPDDFKVNRGDRIAQLILERCLDDAKVKVVRSLPSTDRGRQGFGSTGKA